MDHHHHPSAAPTTADQEAAGHDRHAGHSVAMFRDKFWLSLALTIPTVLLSPEVAGWIGYTIPSIPGIEYVPAILGTIIFFYGGLVFIRGAQGELADRKPGMMTLISLAIIVAFVTSWAGTLGLFEVEIWWELATLITIMLLGHWLEMRSIAQARGALAALAALLPDTAERVTADGTEEVPIARPCGWRRRARPTRCAGPGRWPGRRGERRRRRVDDHRRVPRRRQAARRRRHRRHRRRGRLAARPGDGDRAMPRPCPGSCAWSRRRRHRRRVPRHSPTGPPPCCSTSPSPPASITLVGWWLLGDPEGALVRTVTVLVIACPHALGLAIPLVIAISTSLGARTGCSSRTASPSSERGPSTR